MHGESKKRISRMDLINGAREKGEGKNNERKKFERENEDRR